LICVLVGFYGHAQLIAHVTVARSHGNVEFVVEFVDLAAEFISSELIKIAN
jgi:hypothetical protein